MSIEFHDLRDTPDDLARLEVFFHRLFVPGFPDPDERESLDTLRDNLIQRSAGFYGANNYHIVLGIDGESPVAACIADYMAKSNCGAIEYLIVAEEQRGQGLGRRVHDYTLDLLLADAIAAGQPAINAVMVEINDPYQVSAEVDNANPFERVLMWHRWGYRRLCFPYQQPALSAEQAPVACLLLAVKALNPALEAAFPSALARDMVVDYLVWANRFDAFDNDPFYRRMTAYAASRTTIPCERLDAYIGCAPDAPFSVRPLTNPDDPEYEAMLAVYQRAFAGEEEALAPVQFAHALSFFQKRATRYHVWAFSPQPHAPVSGMATFFSMLDLGFIGYLVLENPLRGCGLARVAIKRIERQMIEDHGNIRYVYLECTPSSPQQLTFHALGFRDLGLAYHQPPLADDADRMTRLGPAMSLMCKRLGDPLFDDPPTQDDLKRHLATILHEVYQLPDPERSRCYQRLFSERAR